MLDIYGGDVKVIALDIYGTILATEDPENGLPPRKGLDDFFNKCDERDIKIVTASDANLDILKIDLEESGVDLSLFDGFYELKQNPKNFSIIHREYGLYGLNCNELLVIGDGQKDRDGALKYNACLIRVPEYKGIDDKFDLRNLEFQRTSS